MTTDSAGKPRPPGKGRLAGRAIFLSASIPHPDRDPRYQTIHNAQVEIEHAVVSLARAVFAEGGQLVFGGHPSISPLVSLVAGEYMRPRSAEREREFPSESGSTPDLVPVLIHQLEAYRTELPDATRFMETLGHARIVWHPMDDSERSGARTREQPAYPRSLTRMRRGMLDHKGIVAMVCIGGMEGVEEEAKLFLEAKWNFSVYVLSRTGGAAALMSQWGAGSTVVRSSVNDRPRVRVVDDEVLRDLHARLRGEDGELHDAPLRYVPYPLIMQVIVAEIAELSGG